MSKILATLFSMIIFGAFCFIALVIWVFYEFGRDLPDYRQLADYQPSVMSRIYAGDGRLVEEYAIEGRVFVPFDSIPKEVVNSFVSSEDKTFYYHPGLDFLGISRAIFTNIIAQFKDRRMVGASTITQQVAKNFLLSNEYTFNRKIKEAILALRIEQTFTKDHILELYLNEIYLGFASYGIAAASMNYFNKSLDELTLSEIAFLAGLPKAPNNYHPIKKLQAARDRRDYVLTRMVDDGYITIEESRKAKQEDIKVKERDKKDFVDGGEYFAEAVRRQLVDDFGSNALYKGGLAVRTSLEPYLQTIADIVLRNGLIEYDLRHGWRGALANIDTLDKVEEKLLKIKKPLGTPMLWKLAVVNSINKNFAQIIFNDSTIGRINIDDLKWARKWKPKQKIGPLISKVSDVLYLGDVILVEEKNITKDNLVSTYYLRQIPEVSGALVVLNPHTGRVLAMTGGFSYSISEFNRATQALRQPGSAFKPLVYLAALDNGYTPSTLVLDAPFVMDQGPGLPKWKPKNYSGKYYGESTLRTGIEKSQNLMTVRLAQALGMEKVGDIAKRFGVFNQLPSNLSASLGSEETTLLKLTAAYAMIVNGGKKITPTIIDRVQDRNGKTIMKMDQRDCKECNIIGDWDGTLPPDLPDYRVQLISQESAYQMVSILQGAVERGTGRKVASIGKPLAGKTGTSNDSIDTWFLGFSPDLAVGVFVGFDDPKTLGDKETGSSVASPIFRDFMKQALKNKPSIPFRIPEGIVLVRVESSNGLPASSGAKNVILEAFKPGTTPNINNTKNNSGSNNLLKNYDGDRPNAGGLY